MSSRRATVASYLACPRTIRSTPRRASSRRPPPCWPCGTCWSRRASSRPTSSSTPWTDTARSSSSSSASAATPRVRVGAVARGHAGGRDRALGTSDSGTIGVTGAGDSSLACPSGGCCAQPLGRRSGAVPRRLWVSALHAPGTRPGGHRSPGTHSPRLGTGAVGPDRDARQHPTVSLATGRPRR
jgi:hypothetical protein